jgi:type I restriction enzyme S subunit
MVMKSQILRFSQLNPKDRLTVEHYISSDLSLIEELHNSKYKKIALGDIAIVRGGKRLPPQASYSPIGVPYIRVVDIGRYTVELDEVVYISDELHKGIERYQLHYNDIAIVIVGATIGKVAIFKSNISPCNFNENMAKITIRDDSVNADYLLVYLQSRYGQAYISWLTGGAAQAKLSLERIQRIEVPLPSRSIQDHIAQIMQDAYAARRAKLAETQSLLRGIDEFFLDTLSIKLETISGNKHFLVNISELNGSRFDVGPYANKFKIESVNAEGSWLLLQDVAHLPKNAKIASKTPDIEFNYIGMSDVDDITGEVNVQHLRGSEIQANKTLFCGNDVVFARIEPCIYNRKIALIPPAIKEAVGSTELLVARAKKEMILPEFLLCVLRSELIQQQIAGHMTGTTGRRRLPLQAFANLKVPKISLEQQRKIVDEVYKYRAQAKKFQIDAEEVVAKARQQVERMILGENVDP